jgi:CDP-glycerol glycerophosphotransferase
LGKSMPAQDPLLSVVIPCGAAPRYWEGLRAMLENEEIPQSLEVVVVNDGGSHDRRIETKSGRGSITIVDATSAPQSVGVSRARNLGLARASGRFVAFLDADDQPDLWQYAALAEDAEWAQVDVAIGDFVRKPQSSLPRRSLERASFNSVELSIVSLVGVWRMVFDRDFLLRSALTFQTLDYGEDLVFALQLGSLQPRVLRSSRKLYVYQDDADSERLSLRRQSTEAGNALLSRLKLEVVGPDRRAVHRLVAMAWALRIWRHLRLVSTRPS